MSGEIYKIVNLVNGNVYIGSSGNLKSRVGEHKSKLRNNKHKNKHLQRAWNKYGVGAFKFEIVEETENLVEREQYWLDFYKENGKVYNQRLECVSSVKGIKFGPRDLKTKNKISNSKKGHTVSEETRRKISESLKGCVFSKERNEKMSKTLKGHTVSEETRRKISEGRILWWKTRK